jgi:3,4-dihydroxy 2-butanone 4-phosphate synthase/GTP cyclohydrolase II
MTYDSSRVLRAIDAVRRGEFVVVADAEDRENEGDLIARADTMTREKMAYLLRHSSGLVCVAMGPERTRELSLPLMVPRNTESHATAFTVSVDLKHGTSTGISAADRALTVRALASADTRPEDLARPGHVFPLRARRGGVLTRAGHTEATVDLAELAGAPPVGVLCEIMNAEGDMLRGAALREFAAREKLEFLTIEELIEFRRRQLVKAEILSSARGVVSRWRVARAASPAAAGETREQQRLLDIALG